MSIVSDTQFIDSLNALDTETLLSAGRSTSETSASAGPMTACDDPDLHYRLSIDLFISGVQAMAEKA